MKKYVVHYLKKMARTTDGLINLARPGKDYFEDRRFAAQKETQQWTNARFKNKKLFRKEEPFKLRSAGTLSGQWASEGVSLKSFTQ